MPGIPGLAGLVCLLAVITWQRNYAWRDDVSLFSALVRVDDTSAIGHYNLGAAYLHLRRCEDVIELSKQAFKNVPDYHMIYNNLGVAFHMLGRYPEAIANYRLAIKLKPDYAMTRYNLGLTFLKVGDANSAMEEYKILKSLDVERADKLLNLIGR